MPRVLVIDDDRTVQRLVAKALSRLYAETVEVMERYLIPWLLSENEGNQSRTAEELGKSRGSLRNKIRTLGISIEQSVRAKIPFKHEA